VDEEFIFTCKDCGSHNLRVVQQYEKNFNCKSELKCFDDCENGHELAAIREFQRIDSLHSWGWLEEDHHYSSEEEEIIESESGDENLEVFCEDCFEDADADDWDYDEELDDDEYECEVYVICDGCDREIEFGWSHPDRGGRIWPAECDDFNPWKCWPEPRYKDVWATKNWLRPSK